MTSSPFPMGSTFDETLASLIADLHRARRVLFITGAGLSADSGVPTYRGIGGLYEEADDEDGLPVESALSGWMLQTRPDVTWRRIHRLERACRGARYNEGHRIIAQLEDIFDRVVVLTQNIDGLQRAAGSGDVIDIHGDLHSLVCTSSACIYAEKVEDFSHLAAIPRCPRCDAIVRPDVVLFGETLPLGRVERLHGELEHGFDVVFSVGTTSLLPYIAGPVLSASREGVPTVEINPDKSSVSHAVRYRFQDTARHVLGRLWSALHAQVA